jgi:hypothetical protein
MTLVTKSPNVAPSKKWAIARRVIRYAMLGFLGLVFCVTLVFWIRSYWRIDHLHGILWGEHRLFVRSGGGEIVFSEYTLLVPTPYPSPYQSWETRSYASNHFFVNEDEFGILVAEGIGSQSDMKRSVRIWWTDSTPKQNPPSPFPFSPSMPPDMACHGIAIPHLLLLLINGSLFFLILRHWQFSLRAFFIWVTIICVAMACAVVFVNHVKEISVIRNIT